MGAGMERRPLARLRVWSIGQCSRRASGGAMVLGVGRERSRAPGTRAICVSTLAQHRAAGVLAITHQPRPEAPSAVAAPGRLTAATPLLQTGDKKATTDRLAIQVGITDVRGGLLPDDKVAAVRQLQAGGAKVAVVGDGINDAPALAAAPPGFAMGGAGSDLTLQTGDAVVGRDDLTAIPAVIALSRRARRVVVANLVI